MLRVLAACAVLLSAAAASGQARNPKEKPVPLPLPPPAPSEAPARPNGAVPLPGSEARRRPSSDGRHLGLYRLVRSNETDTLLRVVDDSFRAVAESSRRYRSVAALPELLAAIDRAQSFGQVHWAPVPYHLSALGETALKLDVRGALKIGAAEIVFVFLFVDLFDNTGTLVGVAHRAGLLDRDGRLPRIGRVFIADSIAAMAGALLGTSTVTSYIESAAGVKAGGRTGLTGVTVAVLFLLTLFLAPLAQSVATYATAPALLFVACLMTRGLAELPWDDVSEYAPAVVTALAMPLTFSIANGIAFGFISYAAVKLLSGRFSEASPSMLVLAALFIVKYAFF